jgi:hypothetical protein
VTLPSVWERPSYLLRLTRSLHEETDRRYRTVSGISLPSTNSGLRFVASNLLLSSSPYVGKFNWAIFLSFKLFVRVYSRERGFNINNYFLFFV